MSIFSIIDAAHAVVSTRAPSFCARWKGDGRSSTPRASDHFTCRYRANALDGVVFTRSIDFITDHPRHRQLHPNTNHTSINMPKEKATTRKAAKGKGEARKKKGK